MQYAIDHIVLNVEDEEVMIAFYSTILELVPERLGEYRAGKVPFPSLRLNPDTIIDLFPKRMWSGTSPPESGRTNLNHFCVALEEDDWHALNERLKANGVPIEEGPVSRWGAHGTGTSIYFRDPENNLIEARFYDRAAAQ